MVIAQMLLHCTLEYNTTTEDIFLCEYFYYKENVLL